MGDLSADELRRLAHEFLALRSDDGATELLRSELESNPAAALEFLTQVQSARPAAALAPFDAEQNEAIRQRVEGLMSARARKVSGLGKILTMADVLRPAHPANQVRRHRGVKMPNRRLAWRLLLFSLMAGALTYWLLRASPKADHSTVAIVPVGLRVPSQPGLQDPAQRADAIAPSREAPLPAELPPATPKASSTWD